MMKRSRQTIPKSLNIFLRAVHRRLRWQEGLRLAPIALNTGLLITLLLLLAGRFYPLALPLTLLKAGLGITLVGLLLTCIYVWLRPRPLLATARLLDRQLKLEERLSTALELSAGKHSVPKQIVQSQLADTVNRLKTLKPAHAFPTWWPWRWLALMGLFMLAIAISLIAPNPQLQALQQQARTEETIAAQKERFEEVRAELLEDKALLETPEGEALLQTLDELIENLEKDNLSLEEAMASVSRAEQTLAKLEDTRERQETMLNDMAQNFSQFDSTADLAEALEQRDMVRAAEALASAGNNAQINPETAQELAEALRQAAQAAQEGNNGELAASLNQAAEQVEQTADQAGQNGDPQATQEAMQRAAAALAEAGQQLANQEAVEQALANIQEARAQLAEANSQGSQGQQPGQGNGLAKGEGTGGGSGREDPGPGAEGLTAEQGTSNQMSTDNGPNEGRTREYEPLYAPSHLGGEGGPIVKPEEQGAQEGLPIGDAPVDPNRDPGEAMVPYNQIYGQYAGAASQALDNSYVPLGMKEYIRNYFGALEPEQ